MLPLNYQSKQIQRLRRLVRQKSHRDAEGVFVVEGQKVLDEALAAGARLEGVYCAPGAVIPKVAAPVFKLESGVIERVSDTVTPQPIMAIVGSIATPIEEILLEDCVLVLSDVRDPGNAGTVLRSAEAAGIGGVIFCAGSVDPFSPKTVRSSAGAVFHVPFASAREPSLLLGELRDAGFTIMGTTMNGGVEYDQAQLTKKIAIVLGNEANGLDLNDSNIDSWLSIPIAGRSESLNVSMAASILSFEVARQRRVGDSGNAK